jgi:hypothetical protein
MASDALRRSGDPSAQPGTHDWMLVDAADPTYADRVIGDLTDITSAPTGRALLRRIFLTKRTVRIVRGAATDPPNAWVRPSNARPANGTDAGSDSVVAYDPTDWPSPAHPGSPSSDAVLFALLGEACRFAEGSAVVGYSADTSLFDSPDIVRYRQERGHV